LVILARLHGVLVSVSENIGARFAVVIVNYNGGAMLVDCVHSALREAVPAPQIIVVDNGSVDGAIENLLGAVNGLTVLRNRCNAGFARAANQGICRATAAPSSVEFILLNNDAQLDSGALEAFAAGFDSLPSLAIAGGQLRYPDGRLQSAFAPLPSLGEEILPRALLKLVRPVRFRRKTLDQNPLAVPCVLGACLCVRRSVLPRLGLLDEDYFFFFEEIEWCRRAGQFGAEVYYLPQARALHGHGQTANRFRGPARVEYQRSKLIFFRKTSNRAAYLLVSAIIVLRTAVNALAGAVACLATLFVNRRLRRRVHTYWYLLFWHLLLRPATWGLPGRCPARSSSLARSDPRGPAHGSR
jgi:N-acetylglucosaminyl-diphospho-decaprenol L-rhamnosyltransferase